MVKATSKEEYERAKLPPDAEDLYEEIRAALKEPGALTDWELEFCKKHLDRWDKFKPDVYLSPKQLASIEKIVAQLRTPEPGK